MAAVTRPRAATERSLPDRARQARGTVRAWAALGAVCVLAQLLVLIRWIDDDGYRLTGGQRAAPALALVLQSLFTAAVVFTLALLTVRAYRESRARRQLSFDAAGITGFLLAAWLDPVQNYLHPVFVQNVHALTPAGSWGPYLPGWAGPPAHTGTWLWLPLLPMYGAFYAAVILISNAMGRLRATRPAWSPRRLYTTSYLVSYLSVALLTQIYPLLAVGVWGHAIPQLTLFDGRWYQWPLYEAPVTALVVLLPAILRFQHLTTGTSAVERGMDRLPARWHGAARLLAVTAAMNATVLLYMAAQIALSLLPGTGPDALPAHIRTTP
ncbi:spirocyclase AveC family protein [Streptomyces sp. NPDC053079]|uniref:spirocyclase AveC family protein n=1 Tax=Streptomyces sp. NPDC053079 TaxID=3365697 RepID=UPI0037D45D75